MSKIVLNLYSYDKKKGYLPKDSNNNILYKTKKSYSTDLQLLYYYLGLEPIYNKVTNKKKITTPDYESFGNNAEYWASLGIGDNKTKYLQYNKHTGKCKPTFKYFIYLYIKDESKLNWNTVLRYLKVKKNTNAFFIKGGKVEKHVVHNNIKVLALPCRNVTKNNLEKIIHYFHNNLSLVQIINPFKFNVNCFTIDDKLLYLNDIKDLVNNVKPIDLNKLDVLNTNKIIHRKGEHYDKEDFITHIPKEIPLDKLIKFSDLYGFDKCSLLDKSQFEHYQYKNSWFIHNMNEYKPKLYQILPNLIRTNNLDKDIAFSVVLNLYEDVCNNKLDLDDLYKTFSKAYEFCLYNQKDLSLKNDRHISNIHYLTPIQQMNIDLYIVPKSISSFCPYKLANNIKQWNKIVPLLAKEIFGKCAYDNIKQNKYYSSRWSKYSDKLDKHINNSFISDKEFNLIIDEIKTNNPDITITPNANIKYEFLKSLGLTIDEETYDFELCGKTIVNALDMLNNILLENLDLIKYLIKDRFYIIIYVKKINDYLTKVCNTENEIVKTSHKTDPPDDWFN